MDCFCGIQTHIKLDAYCNSLSIQVVLLNTSMNFIIRMWSVEPTGRFHVE
jgi:hypothetical protein